MFKKPRNRVFHFLYDLISGQPALVTRHSISGFWISGYRVCFNIWTPKNRSTNVSLLIFQTQLSKSSHHAKLTLGAAKNFAKTILRSVGRVQKFAKITITIPNKLALFAKLLQNMNYLACQSCFVWEIEM